MILKNFKFHIIKHITEHKTRKIQAGTINSRYIQNSK